MLPQQVGYYDSKMISRANNSSSHNNMAGKWAVNIKLTEDTKTIKFLSTIENHLVLLGYFVQLARSTV